MEMPKVCLAIARRDWTRRGHDQDATKHSVLSAHHELSGTGNGTFLCMDLANKFVTFEFQICTQVRAWLGKILATVEKTEERRVARELVMKQKSAYNESKCACNGPV